MYKFKYFSKNSMYDNNMCEKIFKISEKNYTEFFSGQKSRMCMCEKIFKILEKKTILNFSQVKNLVCVCAQDYYTVLGSSMYMDPIPAFGLVPRPQTGITISNDKARIKLYLK